MKEFTYTITDSQGMHARPAGLLVKQTKAYADSITLWKDDKSADAKRLLAVMGLGVKQGEEVRVVIEGDTEQKACEELQRFFAENL